MATNQSHFYNLFVVQKEQWSSGAIFSSNFLTVHTQEYVKGDCAFFGEYMQCNCATPRVRSMRLCALQTALNGTQANFTPRKMRQTCAFETV
jgi:hypothetical protein